MQAQTKHDVQMFDIICQNIRNDLLNLDYCIKSLRKCELEEKDLYEKCAMSFSFTNDIDSEKIAEVEALASQLSQPTV